PAEQEWRATIACSGFGEFHVVTKLSGHHNIANIAQALTVITRLMSDKVIGQHPNEAITNAIASFASVKRRLDHLATCRGIDIYEDFAHHPTAMKVVIE